MPRATKNSARGEPTDGGLLGEEELITWIRALLASWDDVTEDHLPQGDVHQAQFASIYGLTAHAHRSAAAALVLIEQQMVLEAIPVVRTAYECALTAHWLLRVKEGTIGFLREGHRQRKNLLDVGKRVLNEADLQEAERVAAEFSHEPSTADEAARNMQKRCEDLRPGGQTAYLFYRGLSALSHASPYLVDFYLELTDDAELPTLRKLPKAEDPRPWLHLLAAALVWAGQAVNVCDKRHRRRRQLRAAARDLRIALDLRAADHVWVREQRHQQERSRQRRRATQRSRGGAARA